MRNFTATADPQGAPDARRRGVQSIARAAAVLRALGDRPEGAALGELAAATQLPKSTVHRIVAALMAEDLVAQSVDGRIGLGGGIARLGLAVRESVAEQLRPVLLDLRREVDETVDLAVLDGASVRFVDQVPAPRRLRATSSVGELFPLHCTANGKALLAALPEDRAAALLPDRLHSLTPHTIVSLDDLEGALAEVRREGVAYDREEHTEGICAVGAAISDGSDPAAAAISVPVPTPRFRGSEAALAAAVKSAVKTAEALLRPI
jgi:DNA-binding IclR family transcriptional regulator